VHSINIVYENIEIDSTLIKSFYILLFYMDVLEGLMQCPNTEITL